MIRIEVVVPYMHGAGELKKRGREVSAFWLLQSDTITNYRPQVFVPSSSSLTSFLRDYI